MTTLAILSKSADLAFLKPMLEAADASFKITVWPDPESVNAEIAVCWDPPPGIYSAMPNLRLIHSIAAGVDNVITQQDVGRVPVCRVVDPGLAAGMLEYVLWGVIYFHRQLDQVISNQRRKEWHRPSQKTAKDCTVGILGLGELGGFVAVQLASLGYSVSGWGRTPKTIDGVAVLHGDDQFERFLDATDILICLLPLTAQTRGILNKRTFNHLPEGAALIHCGRGEHLVEADLIDALASRQLSGAIIDVFSIEPLPSSSSLWSTPKLIVTPHMATMASNEAIVAQISRNIRQLKLQVALFNQIDLTRGY